MSLPFDATLKDLVQSYPRDWLISLGLPADGPVTPLNVDLSTLSAAADVVLGLGDPLTSLVDLEFQSSRDADLSRRVLVYNTLLHQCFRLPVHSVVVLCRQTAEDAAKLSQGVRLMEESTTFQWIMQLGAIRYMRRLILRQGRKKFGPPDAATETAVQAVDDLDRLDRMFECLLDAKGWQDVLETP